MKCKNKKTPRRLDAPGFKRQRYVLAAFYYILRLEPLVRLRYRELDGLTFFQGAKAFPLDGTEMDENIRFPIRPFQKSITFTCIEPLYLPLNTFRHTQSSRQCDGIQPSGRPRGRSPLKLLILANLRSIYGHSISRPWDRQEKKQKNPHQNNALAQFYKVLVSNVPIRRKCSFIVSNRFFSVYLLHHVVTKDM